MKLYISFELVEQIMMTMIGKNLGMNDNNNTSVNVKSKSNNRCDIRGIDVIRYDNII